MEKPYIKRLTNVSGFTAWIVDGKYIRDNLDIDFVNYGQHYRYNFIPENELWIEKERAPGEAYLYIKPMIAEYEAMSKGIKPIKAWKIAQETEKKEREKANLIKKKTKRAVRSIYKRLLKKYSRKVKVWIVDGELVRNLYSTDFQKGGHDIYYSFIPKNEVWLDDDVELGEVKFILLHELHERALMSKGMKYQPAHKDSNMIELYCRKHPERTDREIRKEVRKNNKTNILFRFFDFLLRRPY